jgi:peptidoglycan glycosyltransferase
MVGNETLYDWTTHRTIASFTAAFDQSCNVAMARMAPLVGAATLTQFLRAFGFGEQDRIDLDIPVAQSRAPLEPDDPMALDMACIGLGNNYRITPLHAAMMAATVANNGVMMAPMLVTDSVILARTPKVLRTTMKKETARQLNALMVDFVKNGIGRKARLLRYTVAGKTGTSGNSKRGLHAWFICFAPAEKPELAMAVLCENGGSGHAVAAPIAQKILSEALR